MDKQDIKHGGGSHIWKYNIGKLLTFQLEEGHEQIKKERERDHWL